MSDLILYYSNFIRAFKKASLDIITLITLFRKTISITYLITITLILKNDIDSLLNLIANYYYDKFLYKSIVLITKSTRLLAINYFIYNREI